MTNENKSIEEWRTISCEWGPEGIVLYANGEVISDRLTSFSYKIPAMHMTQQVDPNEE